MLLAKEDKHNAKKTKKDCGGEKNEGELEQKQPVNSGEKEESRKDKQTNNKGSQKGSTEGCKEKEKGDGKKGRKRIDVSFFLILYI